MKSDRSYFLLKKNPNPYTKNKLMNYELFTYVSIKIVTIIKHASSHNIIMWNDVKVLQYRPLALILVFVHNNILALNKFETDSYISS